MRLRHLSFALLAALVAVSTVRGDAQSATTAALPPDFSDELVASVAAPTALLEAG